MDCAIALTDTILKGGPSGRRHARTPARNCSVLGKYVVPGSGAIRKQDGALNERLWRAFLALGLTALGAGLALR